ncbi:MAG: hypothetical protein AAF991_02775 [Pseudomonadota bacterium]
MPDEAVGLRPINLELFFPDRATMTNSVRLRDLIEGRLVLKKHYGAAYGAAANTLQQVRDGSDPALAGLTIEQKEELEYQLLAVRDEVARGFTQAIARSENDANELGPGTFPREDEPFQSFDLGEWVRTILEGIISILEGIGEIFGAFGFDAGEAAVGVVEAGLEQIVRFGRRQGWWD